MNSKIQAISFMLLPLLMVGCAVTSYSITTPSPSVRAITRGPLYSSTQKITTPQMQSTLSVTETPLQVLTPPNQGAPIIPPHTLLTTRCINIYPSLPPKTNLSGKLVFGSHIDSYLLDLKQMTKTKFPTTKDDLGPDYLSVSPDGKWLSYRGAASMDAPVKSLVFRSSDGISTTSYPLNDSEWSYPGYWINNSWFALVKKDPSSIASLIFLNPFRDQKMSQPADYPGIITDDYDFRFWPTTTIYDPTLSKVIYLKQSDRPTGTNYLLVMWDISHQIPVVELENFWYSLDPPQWTIDGSQWVYVANSHDPNKNNQVDELVLVDTQGKVTQATNFQGDYQITKISSYRWSPDGRYIAFWIWVVRNNESTKSYQLAILDTKTYTTTITCLETQMSRPYPPLWSADDVYLVIYQEGEGKKETTVIDFSHDWAAPISQEGSPLGWLRTDN